MLGDPALDAAAISAAVGIVKTLASEIIKKLFGDAKKVTDAETLTRALSIEVAALADALADRYKWWTEDMSAAEKAEWLPPLVPFYTEAFDQMRNRIEKLAPEIVTATIRFYGFIRFVNGLQEAREEYQERGKQAAFDLVYTGALARLLWIAGNKILPQFNDRLNIP